MTDKPAWSLAITNDLLRYARIERDPFGISPLREQIVGAIMRAVPQSDERIMRGSEGEATLLLLHEKTLYRVTVTIDDETTTIKVDRIDPRRQVVAMALTERHWNDSGRPLMDSRWNFELESGDKTFEVSHSETSPELGDPSREYRFGRAVAVAAGWVHEDLPKDG